MDLSARRLTRSTYIGEPIPTNGATTNNRKRRSSSTDSENGWIPPPPLLPLGTRFLITNPQSPSLSSPPPSPSTSSDPISTQIAIAHLKCQPSASHSNQPNLSDSTTPGLTASFRILSDNELIIPQDPPSMDQDDSYSEFMARETKFFTQRHRQSEMIEKRSKKLEKEKLIHERFKLKNRLELLTHGSGPDWKSIRTLTLRRIKEDELRERSTGNLSQSHSDHAARETEFEKVERMRKIMIQETEETLKRYDKLLDTRKVSRPGSGLQSAEVRPATPLKSQAKSNKPRTSPKASRRKPFNQTYSDQDPTQNNVKLPSFKSKIPPVPAIKHDHQSSQPISKLHDPQLGAPNPTTSLSAASPSTLPKSPHDQSLQPLKTDESAPPLRQSLYETASIRKSAMDDQYVKWQKRPSRSTYALGCTLPDMSKIQLDYLSRLQAMASEQSVPSHSTPFDRPERAIPVQRRNSTLRPTDAETEPADEEDEEDWIEFNPTVNEEKEIISHQSQFGPGSKFFDLHEELQYLEEKKWIEFHQNHLLDKDTIQELSRNQLVQIIHGGKSIRKLIEERMATWTD